MKAEVYNQSGEKTGEVELSERIFAVEKIKPEVVHEVVVSLLASRRNVVAHSKTRGEVRGGGKKPWQQKGTGRARVGSIRSPLWRGGGITFGPRSHRNWQRSVNKKVKTLGLFSVLTDKAKSGQLLVLENLTLPSSKTRELAGKIKGLQAAFPSLGKKLVLVIPDKEKDIVRAGKNLPHIKLMAASSLNILDLLAAAGVIVLKDALSAIEKTYLRKKGN